VKLNFNSATTNSVGDAERDMVAYCTKSGRGTRLIPDGALHGVHFVTTPDYVQVTGVGNFTGLGVRKGDSGGELDNRGADGRGNPSVLDGIQFLYKLLIIFSFV